MRGSQGVFKCSFAKMVLLVSAFMMSGGFPPKCSGGPGCPGGVFFSLKPQAIQGPGWVVCFSDLVPIKQTLRAAQAE